MKSSSHWFLLGVVLIAFAANSILCRLALKPLSGSITLIDPASFTTIRLISGAFMLLILVLLSDSKIEKPSSFHLRGAIFLFVYAVAFSFAYIELDAAVGALILFGIVQVCIISISVLRGNRLSVMEWMGCVIAISGLLVLTLPHLLQSLSQNEQSSLLLPVLLMTVSGIAWGLFTVNGSSSKNSLLDTTSCFVITVPVSLVLMGIMYLTQGLNISYFGALLAVLSGALASGMGYALWYKILPELSSSQASTSQLLVPVIAAVGGTLFLGEALTINFLIATLLTLGGVLIVINASVKKKKTD